MASMTIESLVPDAEVMVFPRGPVGPGAELRLYPAETPTHIQWRQENGAWVNLIALSTLVGPAGPTGITWRSEGWDNVSEFNVRDVLFHDEKIWIATADNVNEEPGDTDAPWDVLLDGSSIASDRILAEGARDKAQEWAEKAEDSAVEPGAYSSKHWAAKSEGQKDLAVTAKTDAETARDKAEKWADEDEDVEVEPGKFSAKHWSEKAQDAATGGASSISVTPAGNIAATNVQAALEELDTEKAKVGAVTGSGITMTTARVLGRTTASTGAVEELSSSALRTFVGSGSESATGVVELATQAETDTGTDDARAVTPLKLTQSDIGKKAVVFAGSLLHVSDEKSSGTSCKTYAATTWTTADLNTVKTNQVSGASLATNQVTLPAGTYIILAFVGAHTAGANAFKTRLRDITNSVTLVVGANSKGILNSLVNSELHGRFTLAGTAALEIQLYPTALTTAGGAASSGDAEVYAEAMIWKVA